jgi:hypothetical protein
MTIFFDGFVKFNAIVHLARVNLVHELRSSVKTYLIAQTERHWPRHIHGAVPYFEINYVLSPVAS